MENAKTQLCLFILNSLIRNVGKKKKKWQILSGVPKLQQRPGDSLESVGAL